MACVRVDTHRNSPTLILLFVPVIPTTLSFLNLFDHLLHPARSLNYDAVLLCQRHNFSPPRHGFVYIANYAAPIVRKHEEESKGHRDVLDDCGGGIEEAAGFEDRERREEAFTDNTDANVDAVGVIATCGDVKIR
jgi:hypothetical protein